jgi:hypothetical protein
LTRFISIQDIATNEWEKIGKYKTRKLEYTMEGPVVGSKFCKTTEIEVNFLIKPQV